MKNQMLVAGPYLGLLLNALAWGVSWWPLRHLQQQGLHPLWATVLFFALGAVLISVWRPQVWRGLLTSRAVWALAVAAGTTNAAFNWAVSVGDVVRVVLLFYLMPLWAILLAWWMMGEPITKVALLRVALALVGAVLVLLPEGGQWPTFDGLADWLGLVGGFCFAWTNVLLRQQAQVPASTRAMAMFMGGTVWPLGLGLVLWQWGVVPAWPVSAGPWLWVALAMGVVFLASNLALQYGAAKLPVQVTSVVMLTEVVFATLSSVWWGGAVLTWQVLSGGTLILLVALLSSLTPAPEAVSAQARSDD